ncbi:MAG: anti-sigma factor [Burkholderiales bacterium]|nr:anti-sigma factor [Burkholderiales bacterium]
MNLSRPDRLHRLDALAAAYALGTLPARARLRLARVAQTDIVVAATIREWEQRLSPLSEAGPPIVPPPQLWRLIALRLGLAPERPHTRVPWWKLLAFWRVLALVAFIAVLALAVVLLSPRRDVTGPPIVVVMSGADARPALIATLTRGGRIMTVKVVDAAPVPADKSLELWMLPEDAPPRSLGVIPAVGVGRIGLPVPPEFAFARVPTLVVSLEQAGGSPTGAPQGPVLYSGKVERFY